VAEPLVLDGTDEIREQVGKHVGNSDWTEITQEQVQQFADATGDHQWIHVDPERAAEGPFGGPIAHGFLTLSLIPRMLPEILDVRGFSFAVNYGLEKARFPAPIPVGSRIRAALVVDEVKEVSGGIQITETLTFEIEGGDKPACVATFVERRFT
jgi:acyl dehydratase